MTAILLAKFRHTILSSNVMMRTVLAIETPWDGMKAMRVRWAVSVLMVAGAVVTASAQSVAPFALRISGPGTVAAGQPVPVRVLLQNTSDHAISVNDSTDSIASDESVLSIRGPLGQELPRKQGGWVSSGGMGSLAPGELSDDVIRVDSLYDLSEPGRYTLQLRRHLAEDRGRPDYRKDGFIVSNVITVSVSPEAVKPSAPVTLTLTGPETFISGDDVLVKALVKNVSDQDIFLVTDPDGNVADRYYRLDTFVGPNNAEFSRFLGGFGERAIRTISPGATLEAVFDKKALRFSADWIAPRIYQFQLAYSATANWENNLAKSAMLTVRVMPAPAGGSTPFTLTLSGPETVAAGDSVRVHLAMKNRSNFEIAGPVKQLNLLRYRFSVRDESKRELPLNELADGVKGANSSTAIQPGDTISSYAALSEFYDLSRPGTYCVQMSEPAYGFPGTDPVFSNILTIHVTSAARR